MANPFNVQFDSDCQDCGNFVDEGGQMFAHDGLFICEQCARDKHLICHCGNYKKECFELCYDCSAPKESSTDNNWWPDTDVVESKDMKPQMDMNRALSWSAISSFEYDPEQWYASYVLGKRQESKEMDFGSYVDKKIQNDPTFLPDLPRYEKMQYKMKCTFEGIPLVGLPDGLNFTDSKVLADYKTGKKAWDKKRTDETGQLTMYLLLLFITEKRKPEEFECRIHWLPTQDNSDFTISFVPDIENKIKTFTTKRTMRDLLEFGQRIKRVYGEMQEYARNHAI